MASKISGSGSGKTKTKKGGKQVPKKPGRGMGVAQLERIRTQESWKLISDLNPVCPIQTGFGVQMVHPQGFIPRPNVFYDPNPVRVLPAFRPELDFQFNTFSFKKKRVVNGEDLEGFVRENKCYQGAEILAVHRKGVGSRNMVMEYGFFPANSAAATSSSSSSSASVSGYATNCYYPANNSIDLSLRL